MYKKLSVLFVALVICISSLVFPVNFKVKATAAQKLYVGGVGDGNYTTIQGAINDANNGDTVFVYDNSYNENVVISVSIDLNGEDYDIPVIDGNGNGTAVTITADWVNLTGFTIQNSGDGDYDAGLKIESNYTNISGNIIKDCNARGILLDKAENNTIYNNTFTNITNTSSIFLWNSSSYNTIAKNNITNCGCAR